MPLHSQSCNGSRDDVVPGLRSGSGSGSATCCVMGQLADLSISNLWNGRQDFFPPECFEDSVKQGVRGLGPE